MKTPKSLKPRKPNSPTVYFLQGVHGGAIKIGYTTDLPRRLKALQTGYPDKLRVLLAIYGTTATEKAIHKRLVRYRLHGEWFMDAPEVRAVIWEYGRGNFERVIL